MSNKMYMQDGKLVVPDHVVIPFIEGDGVGAEIRFVRKLSIQR